MDIIHNILESENKSPKGVEILGDNQENTIKTIESEPAVDIVKKWYKDHLKDYPDDIAMWKWKPYCFDDPEILKVLDYLVSECIPIIYSHRNPIDVNI